MLPLRQLLDRKGRAIHSIDSEEPVLEALRLMAEHHIGALLVMRGGELAGIVSERDYARKVILHGRSSSETLTWEIMSTPVLTIPHDSDVEHAMQLMTEHRVRHLPVMSGARVVAWFRSAISSRAWSKTRRIASRSSRTTSPTADGTSRRSICRPPPASCPAVLAHFPLILIARVAPPLLYR